MAKFILVPTNGTHAEMEVRLKEFGNKALRLPKGEWLVEYEGTTKQLSDELGISNDKDSSTIVLAISGFWGRSSANHWEWLGLKNNA